MGMINRLTRLGTVGLVGDSPKNKVRKQQARILKAEADSAAESVKAAKAARRATRKAQRR